jgi:hypothetical protein
MNLASSIYIEPTRQRNGSSQQRLHYLLLLIKLITHSPVAVARINSNNTDRRKKLRMTTSPRRKCPTVRNHMEDSSKMAGESPLRRALYRHYIQEMLPKLRRDSCLHSHAVSDKKKRSRCDPPKVCHERLPAKERFEVSNCLYHFQE